MINPKFGAAPTKQQQTGKFHGISAFQISINEKLMNN
jgi:hypothetical protein